MAALFPDMVQPAPVEGMNHFRDPARFEAALSAAGFADVRIVETSSDYLVEAAALDDPARLFQFSPVWAVLDEDRRARRRSPRSGPAWMRQAALLPVPSRALIATGRRI